MKKNNIELAFAALFLILYKIEAVPQIVQQTYKIILLCGLFIYLFRLTDKKRFVNMVAIYGISITLSSFLGALSGSVGYASVAYAVVHTGCLMAAYLLLDYCAKHGCMERAMKALLRVTAVACAVLLVSIIIQGTSPEGTSVEYVFGSKFTASYLFVLFASLIYMVHYNTIQRNWESKLYYLMLALAVMLLCKHLYCTTAFLASALLVIAPLVPRKLRDFLMKPSTILAVMIIFAVIPLMIDPILENSTVQYILTEVLGESVTLTGRKKIYAALPGIITGNLFLGHGYGNEVVRDVVSFGNAQNGLLQHLVDYGLIGTVLFLILVYRCVSHSSKKRRYWPVYVLAYTMIVSSIVEISYNFTFFLAIFILRSAEGNRKRLSTYELIFVRGADFVRSLFQPAPRQRSAEHRKGKATAMMDSDTLEKLHNIELEIMDEIHRLCEKHGIRYYLAEGSALGAVRHQGFIPWDDDIDICMPREDYDRFVQVCAEELDQKFYLQDDSTSEHYIKFMAKVQKKGTLFIEEKQTAADIQQGIFVDVFVLENAPKSLLLRRVLARLIWMCTGMISTRCGIPANSRLERCVSQLFDVQTLKKMRQKLLTAYAKKKTPYYINYGSIYGVRKQTFDKAMFGKPTPTLFSGRMYNVPQNVNAMLEQVYGSDYMELPPVEKRTCHQPVKLDFGGTE